MAYLGENNHFSFHDGLCEALPRVSICSANISTLGQILSLHFNRFYIGCEDFSKISELYALCSGISEGGGEVYICENTDMPSLRFGCTLLPVDCGIFILNGTPLKIAIFNKNGFVISESTLSQIMKSEKPNLSEQQGNIYSMTSFRNVYINNLMDIYKESVENLSSGVSCGNRNVRTLWQQFFKCNDDDFVLQITDNGNNVNAYSTKHGYIPAEKLILAYCVKNGIKGQTVLLPDSFHYALENTEKLPENSILRFKSIHDIPDWNGESRFLWDWLYMCIDLLRDKREFFTLIDQLSQISISKREIAFRASELFANSPYIMTKNGRVIITRSDKRMIAVIAQTLSAETSAELCAEWCEKLRKLDICRDFP